MPIETKPLETKPGQANRYEAALPADCILAFPLNPRTEFEPQAMQDLTESIRQWGVLQPVLVRTSVNRHGRQFYDLVAGERRLRAAQAAGLAAVPAIIYQEMLHTDAVLAALSENMCRQDLTAIEIAQTYRALIESLSPKMTQKSIARRMGTTQANVSNLLALLSLPPGVQALIKARRLPSTAARTLFYYWKSHPEIDVQAAAESISDGQISVHRLNDDFAHVVLGASPKDAPVDAPPKAEQEAPTAQDLGHVSATPLDPASLNRCDPETLQLETRQVSPVETRQVSPVETRQVSPVETRQVSPKTTPIKVAGTHWARIPQVKLTPSLQRDIDKIGVDVDVKAFQKLQDRLCRRHSDGCTQASAPGLVQQLKRLVGQLPPRPSASDLGRCLLLLMQISNTFEPKRSLYEAAQRISMRGRP